MYSFSNFPVFNPVLLTIIIMVSIRYSEFTHLIAGSLYLFEKKVSGSSTIAPFWNTPEGPCERKFSQWVEF